MNPYADEYPLIPIEEIAAIVKKYKLKRGRYSGKNAIGILDIARETKVRKLFFFCIMKGVMPPKHWNICFGKVRHRRVSRFLVKLESGMVKKENYKIIYLDEPTRPMTPIRKVSLGLNGPKLMKPDNVKISLMPSFKDVFSVKPTIDFSKIMKQ
jgi:hypothetical protein